MNQDISALEYALIGDAVYALQVKEYLVLKGNIPVNKITEKSKEYLSAVNQATFMHKMLEEKFLSEEEEDIYKWGRNSHTHSKAKNADAVSYQVATGFECLYGYLYLNNNKERLIQFWDFIRTFKGE